MRINILDIILIICALFICFTALHGELYTICETMGNCIGIDGKYLFLIAGVLYCVLVVYVIIRVYSKNK